ncbi:PO113 protein, partial [Dicrurus megarhynchus]|nr:PO113 protein [Dicrurus megarhynchus]
VKFLGYQISHQTVAPLPVQIRREIRTLHDAQQLVGAIQWLRPQLGLSPTILSPLYQLLKGDKPWEP